jgi:predicted nucleic acid-binding Zn ribbon protein
MSKFVKEAQPKVAKHRHCTVCHTPILDLDRQFCSQKCEEQSAKTERNRKLTTFALILLFPVILFIMTLLRG